MVTDSKAAFDGTFTLKGTEHPEARGAPPPRSCEPTRAGNDLEAVLGERMGVCGKENREWRVGMEKSVFAGVCAGSLRSL